MKMIYLGFVSMLFIGCGNSNSNGACDWHVRKFSATVINISFDNLNTKGDSVFSVKMMFDAGSLSEKDQDLGKLRGFDITREKLIQNKLKVNSTYTGKINDLKSGNCETPIVAFDQRLR
jgi:hypothetical protein|tara:strand:- start:8133 stop:8489 length:357 start_codon:yes stop_codon:yes gene_type:complete